MTIKEEYNKAYRNYLARIRRVMKEGYDTSIVKISRVKRPTRASIRRLEKQTTRQIRHSIKWKTGAYKRKKRAIIGDPVPMVWKVLYDRFLERTEGSKYPATIEYVKEFVNTAIGEFHLYSVIEDFLGALLASKEFEVSLLYDAGAMAGYAGFIRHFSRALSEASDTANVKVRGTQASSPWLDETFKKISESAKEEEAQYSSYDEPYDPTDEEIEQYWNFGDY